MKLNLIVILSGALLFTSNQLKAGEIASGGGMSVVCQNNGQSIHKLLDLFESEVLFGEENVARASGNLNEDYARLVGRTYTLQGAHIDHQQASIENLERFFEIVEWVNEPLPFLNDQGRTVTIPANCEIKQLAIFYDTENKVKIDQELWNQLDSMSQAALVEHELFYHHERKYNELNSESTRSYIHQILTADIQTPVLEGTGNASLMCTASNHVDSAVDFVFYVTKNGANESELQFTAFAQRPLLVKSTLVTSANFEVHREVDTNFPNFPFVDVPNDVTANIVETLPLETIHRDDWTAKIIFKAAQPVSIQALQNNAPITAALNVNCREI